MAVVDGVSSVSGDATFYSDVDLKADLNVDGSLNVEVDTEIDGNLVIHSDATVDGDFFVQGSINFDSIGILDNDLHVGQDIYAHDDLYVEDFAQISGAVHIINFTKNNVDGLHVNGNPNNGAEPEDDSYHSILWVQGNTVCSPVKTYLTTLENEDFGGFLRAVNPYDIDVIALSQTCSSGHGLIEVMDVSGGSSFVVNADPNPDVCVVSVTGSACLTENVTISGDILAGGSVTISGGLLTSSAIISGDVLASSATISGDILASSMTVSGSLDVSGVAEFDNDVIINEDLSVVGTTSTSSAEIGDMTATSEIVSLSGDLWVELSISTQKGAAMLMASGNDEKEKRKYCCCHFHGGFSLH